MVTKTTEGRRSFLSLLTAALGTVVGALAVVPGLGFLATPLRRATTRGGDEPTRVASEAAVKVGKPLLVTAVGRRQDAWLRLDRVTLGSVWLLRPSEGAPIKAFSNICPHLGCAVDWNDGTNKFDCPCHASSFDPEGRCLGGPSPRGLDELDVDVQGKDVLVRYQRFRIGTPKKEPLG